MTSRELRQMLAAWISEGFEANYQTRGSRAVKVDGRSPEMGLEFGTGSANRFGSIHPRFGAKAMEPKRTRWDDWRW